ncbi:hypothetical protein AVEN_76159-1 [Araneus ventricosus]|uniref:Uncharacterized protein n=1 Tax=Araneus ventricosus TaxID=182803 RepID=A0A4Y2E5M1_ARAVE|nr:hypothetical protein AVEN_76159-1 [Araneus ventricosus]
MWGLLHVKSYVVAKHPPAVAHCARPIQTGVSPGNRTEGTLVWCESLERERELRCRLRHLTTVENYDVRPKIALLFLQNWSFKLV